MLFGIAIEVLPQHRGEDKFRVDGGLQKIGDGRTARRIERRTQGTLFFDVARIIDARRPAIFVLENVKNLKSHDGGKTFRIIMQTLDELGYDVADSDSRALASG